MFRRTPLLIFDGFEEGEKIMKRRLLIVLAIAALLSLTVLAACDTHEHKWSPNHDDLQHWQECECGDKKDVANHAFKPASDGKSHWQECECGAVKDKADHELSWKSDAANHWQECDSCDFKSTSAAHVDVKNNETQAEGADGKCDVCAHEIFAVIFDMQGRGNAVDSQNVGKGGKATAPQAPANDDAWKFGGWYKESGCINEFDFSAEVINEATTVYAKWTEDTTEGASKAHAYVLTLGEESINAIQKDAPVYYVYTAVADGRYTIYLGQGLNSQKCTFVTDKTEGVYDKDNDKVNIDLAADEKVYITLSCAEELDAEAEAGVYIDECTGGDVLPEGIFPTGEYLDVKGSFNLQFDRDEMKAEIYETPFLAGYVGGKYNNKLVIVRSMSVGTEVWTIVPGEKAGEYNLTVESTYDPTKTAVLTFSAPAEPIALEKFSGVYVPKDSENSVNGISQFVIYEDGRGYFVQNDYKNKQVGSYNQMRNILTLGQYTLTLNLDGETVVSISISSNSIDGSVEYTRKGDSVWIELPVKGKEYVGSTLSFVKNEYDAFGLYQWTESYNEVEITAYDQDSKVYTVLDGATVYKFVVEEGQIKVYAEDGTTLVDTLVEFVPVFHDMPASGVEQTLNISDFQKNYYWYKVSKEGWYTIVASGDYTVVYYGLDEDNPVNGEKEVGEKAVLLAVDDIVGVYIGNYYENIPESIALTVTEVEAPAGLSEEKPIDLVNGSYVLEGMDKENVYYFRYVGLKAGSYVIGCTYEDWDGEIKSIHYVINGSEYGCEWDDANWSYAYYGGVTANSPYASIVVTADGDLLIAVDRKTEMGDFADITVTVAADYREGATALTAAAGTLEAGNYKIEDLSEVESVILGEGDNQVILNKNSLQFGFKVESSVSYVINYVLGSEKNPVKVNANGTTQVLGGQYVTITAPAGQDTLISLGSVIEYGYPVYFSFEYNGKTYGYGQNSYNGSYYPLDKVSLSIAGGESVTIRINVNNIYDGEDIPLIVSEDYVKSAIDVELIKGEPADDKIVASATISASGTYNIGSIGSAITVTSSAAFTIKPIGGEDIVATEAEGVFSATIDSSVSYFVVTLADGQSITLSVEYAKGSENYPIEPTFTDGVAQLTIAAGEMSYVKLPVGSYSLSTESTGLQIILNGEYVSNTVTIKEGDLLLVGSRRLESLLLISELKEIFTEEQVGNYKLETVIMDEPCVITLKFDIFGAGVYNNGVDNFNIAITKNADGSYSFVYDEGTVKFVFENGKVKFTENTDTFVGTVELEKEQAIVGNIYSGQTSGGINISLTINADFTSGKFSLADPGDGEFDINDASVTITKDGDKYSFTAGEGFGAVVVEFTVSGDTLNCSESYYGTFILTKQA